MTRQRADLGFADELDSFDPGNWTPAAPVNDRAQRPEAQQAATAAGFKSREPRQQEPPRRRRTGRNMQFNIKARPETIEAFCQIADANGWGFGETLEHAVALLQREHLPHGGSAQK
jgi:hypothetical protein